MKIQFLGVTIASDKRLRREMETQRRLAADAAEAREAQAHKRLAQKCRQYREEVERRQGQRKAASSRWAEVQRGIASGHGEPDWESEARWYASLCDASTCEPGAITR